VELQMNLINLCNTTNYRGLLVLGAAKGAEFIGSNPIVKLFLLPIYNILIYKIL
jgi:hypothetical protein